MAWRIAGGDSAISCWVELSEQVVTVRSLCQHTHINNRLIDWSIDRLIDWLIDWLSDGVTERRSSTLCRTWQSVVVVSATVTRHAVSCDKTFVAQCQRHQLVDSTSTWTLPGEAATRPPVHLVHLEVSEVPRWDVTVVTTLRESTVRDVVRSTTTHRGRERLLAMPTSAKVSLVLSLSISQCYSLVSL